MTDYRWKPIEPLSDSDLNIDLAAIVPLYESWRASKARLQQSSSTSLRDFTQRLIRRLSIETGILERLYDLDRGTTEALVTHGFVEELISRSSTDVEPSQLIDILRDQESAIQIVLDCVAGKRELTKGILHELQAVLTRHQITTTAVDQFGTRREIPLPKGKFKELPNNPKRPDGTIHEYCPPIHVETEVDNLLRWLSSYHSKDPVIVAAWLHHRFAQIHPYQDGNGRVARALTTLVLLRADLLPLVIDRDLRMEYIESLEAADAGNLSKLASIFARLQRAAILEALSVDIDAEISHQQTLTAAVIESLAAKLEKRHHAKHTDLRKVNGIAVALRTKARITLEQSFTRLKASVRTIADSDIHISDGGPDRDNAHWYKFEVVKSANESGKFANFSEDHFFVKASVRIERERLVFVVSFHHVGRELSGIMEATAFARLESFEDSEDRESVSQEFRLCSLEPFVFTHKTLERDIVESFARWIDAAIAIAIKEYGDRL